MQDTYLPGFESCISPSAGGGSGIMCSYNAVNGVPSCANTELLKDYARDKWGFNGYITGDWYMFIVNHRWSNCILSGAVGCVQDGHNYTKTTGMKLSVIFFS